MTDAAEAAEEPGQRDLTEATADAFQNVTAEDSKPANEANAEATTVPDVDNGPDDTKLTDSTLTPQRLSPDYSVVRLIGKANKSAGKLVNLLAKHFPCFNDETRFDGRRVRLLKRAQIFVADLWAAFNGTGYGEFHDIDHLTMFAGKHSIPRVYSLRPLTLRLRLPCPSNAPFPRRFKLQPCPGIHSPRSERNPLWP
jgi:hypothetical protein